MKRKGVGTQKESMICCVKFMTKISKRIMVLTEEILNGLSAPTYCRPLDATTLREMIGSNKRLIVEDPAPGVPRVAMPILSYAGVFEYMARHYGVPLQGDYAPPSYEEHKEQDEE
nr:hypothetical protein [Tanacetum cinerariifolium]